MAQQFRADLHCHSNRSDGNLTPQQLIDLACKKNLNGLSITDHDTIEAYQEAIPTAQSKQLPIISGVELSCFHRQTSVHILGYSFDLNSKIMNDFCAHHKKRRENRLEAILDCLKAIQMPLTINEVLQSSNSLTPPHSIGRPHIAQAMINKGYVNTLKEAFNLYLGEGRSCYVAGEIYSVEETIHLIHQSCGLAVIAHPHLVSDPKILQDLLQMDFDGIEGYYARFPQTAHDRWIKIGAKKGWIITGGSDFHGIIKPAIDLGSSWVNEETFSILFRHFQQHTSNKNG